MALFKSALMTTGTGKIGGMVIFPSSGGLALRALVIPVNPNTPAQSLIRSIMSDLSNRWVNNLTQFERDAWKVYAENTPITGKLGDPITLSGLNMYIRANVVRAQAFQLQRQDVAPIVFDLGSFTPVVNVTAKADQKIQFDFFPGDDWANEDGASMLVYASRPQNQSIDFFRGPYRLASQVDGNGTIPPVPPATITAPFTITTDQKVFIRIRVTRNDGRLSNEQFESAIVTAA